MSQPDFEGWDPADHILPGLLPLVVPIDSVHPMPKNTNPQRGDVKGIAAALSEYRQHIPIVARESDGVILKGNNTWDAAKNELGWPGLAVVWVDDDDQQALGRMLSDNITSMNARQDNAVFAAIMPEVIDFYPETFEILGYDPYEMAALEETHEHIENAPEPSYIPPVMILPVPEVDSIPVDPGSSEISSPPPVVVPVASPSRAITSYTIVFDSTEQQQRWYAFMRWLRANPEIEGETIGAKIIEFNEMYAEF